MTRIDFDETNEIVHYASEDIAEAQNFADKGEYVMAINILDATVRGFERVSKQYPQLAESLTPFIEEATKLTIDIIQRSQAIS